MQKRIQRSNWLYFLLINLPIWLVLFAIGIAMLTGCSLAPEPTESPPKSQITIRPSPSPSISPLPIVPIPTKLPSPIPTDPIPGPEQYNFLLLGGDYRAHRQGTNYGNKTDVMLLVSLLMTDPIKAHVIQIPRNLYVPVRAFPDMYAFSVFSLEHWQGLHYWWQEVFGIDLTATFYVHMDNFVSVIDDLGGIMVHTQGVEGWGVLAKQMSGEETLAYLRDNENNWGCKHYDCQGRQFRVFNALFEAARDRFMSDPIVAANMALENWGTLIESDISTIEQFVWIFRLGWAIHNSEMEVSYHQLAAPNIQRGPVPLDPGRAEVPVVDLSEWISDLLRR